MQQLNAIVVDDEAIARQRIQRLLEELGVSVVAQGQNGQQAIDLVKAHKAELLFLDINMPLMSGIDAAQTIVQLASPPAIIFCTAHDEFAMQAFNTTATAYLLKPIFIDNLKQAIAKAMQVSQLQVNTVLNDADENEYLIIRHVSHHEKIPLEKVQYFRSHDKSVVAGLLEEQEIIVDSTLKELESRFAKKMVRTHKSSLINKQYLQRLARDDDGHMVVSLKDCERTFLVSRRYLAHVKQAYDD